MIVKNLYHSLRNIFLPPFCNYCKKFLDQKAVFCENCSERITPIVSTKIEVTKKYSITVFALSSYKDPLKRLILAKGYSQPIASIQMAELIWQRSIFPVLDFDMLVPIPLHWTRKAWRGYNQAAIMAKKLAALSNKPCIEILKRTKRTVPQSQLGIDDRSKNLKSAFSVDHCDESIYGKHIILIDDLMTTGATLQAAAKELISLKPSALSAFVTCRVI